MQLVSPVPFREALDKLGARTIVGAGLNSEQWSAVPLALRERAFFSATVESTRFLQRARDSIGDFLSESREVLPNGQTALKTGSRAQFVRDMQQFAISEGLGPLDPAAAGTIKDIRSQRRLELIFDTQTRQAQDYGYYKQGMDPAILAEFPAQRFIRERAVQEPRDTHVLHENEVQLKSNVEFWRGLNRDFGVPWGPWGWGCGHDVEDVDRDEAELLGLIKPGEAVAPVEKPFNDRLEASVQNLDPDLQSQLKDAFGDQIIIENDTARWAGQSTWSTPSTLVAPVAPPTRAPSAPSPPAPLTPALALMPSTGSVPELIRLAKLSPLLTVDQHGNTTFIRELRPGGTGIIIRPDGTIKRTDIPLDLQSDDLGVSLAMRLLSLEEP